ncbi:MAG TPA: NUDIX domain-containing protein [Pseudomonadales bacterium]
MAAGFDQQDVEILSETLAYDGFFKLKALRLRHRLFGGGWSPVIDRELSLRKDAVGVLLYDPQAGCFALVEQLRIGALGRERSPWLLELVAGMLDKPDEDAQAVAHRETREEAGLALLALEPVCRYFCSPGGSNERFTLYCGRVALAGVSGGVFGVDGEHEDIRLHILPVEEVLARLASGEIDNAMSIIALQWFQLNRQRLDALWHD